MACLVNEDPKACMFYCETITNKTNLKVQDTWDCYQKYNVPKSYYGLS